MIAAACWYVTLSHGRHRKTPENFCLDLWVFGVVAMSSDKPTRGKENHSFRAMKQVTSHRMFVSVQCIIFASGSRGEVRTSRGKRIHKFQKRA